MKTIYSTSLALSLLGTSFAQDTARPAPKDDKERKAIAIANAVRPAERQVIWKQHGLTAFIHYGINTYNNVEWGSGKEKPSEFKATTIGCKQWAKELKNAGCGIVILTAKHHEGFCMWPSRYTDHDVASSPY